MLNSINSLVNFVQIWQKVISLVTMATNIDSKLLTNVFLFLSGTDHSVKVLSNSESVRAGALLEFFGGYRKLMLRSKTKIQCFRLPDCVYFPPPDTNFFLQCVRFFSLPFSAVILCFEVNLVNY